MNVSLATGVLVRVSVRGSRAPEASVRNSNCTLSEPDSMEVSNMTSSAWFGRWRSSLLQLRQSRSQGRGRPERDDPLEAEARDAALDHAAGRPLPTPPN